MEMELPCLKNKVDMDEAKLQETEKAAFEEGMERWIEEGILM